MITTLIFAGLAIAVIGAIVAIIGLTATLLVTAALDEGAHEALDEYKETVL